MLRNRLALEKVAITLCAMIVVWHHTECDGYLSIWAYDMQSKDHRKFVVSKHYQGNSLDSDLKLDTKKTPSLDVDEGVWFLIFGWGKLV